MSTGINRNGDMYVYNRIDESNKLCNDIKEALHSQVSMSCRPFYDKLHAK
jgi:hypothetical protein